jgi:hypothetical protein
MLLRKKIFINKHFNSYLASLIYPISNYEKPFPNADCVNANINAPYKCIFGDYLQKYIKSDLFLIQSQYDTMYM